MSKKIYLIVKADTNDADYITSKTLITEENIIKLKSILEKIERRDFWYYENGDYKDRVLKKHHTISWETGDIASSDLTEQHPELTEEELWFLDDYIPHGEHGVHTIESMEILVVEEEYDILRNE